MSEKKKHTTSQNLLFPAIVRRVARLSSATGQLTLPAVPTMVETYAVMLEKIFDAFSRPVVGDHGRELRRALLEHLEAGFARTPHAKVVISYSTDKMPAMSITYTISHVAPTMEEEYRDWVESREPPLFGTHPDAKVMDVARALAAGGEAKKVTCLDAGAGTGRNTLPLAKAGYTADALEPAMALVEVLQGEVEDAKLPVSVVRGSILDEGVRYPRERYRFVFLSEVVASHFRKLEDVRTLFRRLSKMLEPGGVALFNAFIAAPGYSPDRIAREVAQHCWCPIYTRSELEEAVRGQPLKLIGDESAPDYEEAHLPKEAWPPTSWYIDWAGGGDLFDLPLEKTPFEMRWLTYERTEAT